MASQVFMKILESAPQRYDRGINLLSLGQSKRIQQEIVGNYITTGDEFFEIGCGTGTLAVSCAEKGASVVSFDIPPQMLAIARLKEMLPKAAILVGLANEVGIPNDHILIDPGLIRIASDVVGK